MRRCVTFFLPAALSVTLLLNIAPAFAQNQTVGLFAYDTASFEGYTLIAPMTSTSSYLIDNYGRTVHTWASDRRPAASAYLLEDGSLLRTAYYSGTAGSGGGVQIIDWDGTLIWDYIYYSDTNMQHHDVARLPNGNVLILAWEYRSDIEAIAAGRNPALLDSNVLWPEQIVEVMPTGPTTGTIVWEWHLWDHLIQDFDAAKDNYGDVAEHPELIDLNFVTGNDPDWIHANAIDYNPDLNQIAISAHHFNELWIVDHSTTTEEAAGHTGGNNGRGGDILYRWGNPQTYRAGTETDQKLFGQHNVHWIPPGLDGAGNILIYNNGFGRPDGAYSTVEEIMTPVDEDGRYQQPAQGVPYGPVAAVWQYIADPLEDMNSNIISGAQRQPNGNTLICSGRPGTIREVTPDGDIVWAYLNPAISGGTYAQGDIVSPGTNFIFRSPRYAPDYPGLVGRDITPGALLETYPITVMGTSHYPVTPIDTDSIVITTHINTDNPPAVVELNLNTGTGYVNTIMHPVGFSEDNGFEFTSVVAPLPEQTFASYYIYVETAPDTSLTDPPNASAIVYHFTIGGEAPLYVCGDANFDDGFDIGDAVFLINYIFRAGPPPVYELSGDVNCDNLVNVGDPVYMINTIFKGGPGPCEACR